MGVSIKTSIFYFDKKFMVCQILASHIFILQKEVCNMSAKEDNIICIGVRIPKELHEELTDLAYKKDLTLSQLVRIAIKKIIADNA